MGDLGLQFQPKAGGEVDLTTDSNGFQNANNYAMAAPYQFMK